MAKETRGVSLDYLSDYYDVLTPAERSEIRRKQIDLIGLEEGERVLEVGCGTGVLSFLSKLAVGEAGEVAGIDIAPKMVSRAQALAVEHARFHQPTIKVGFDPTRCDGRPRFNFLRPGQRRRSVTAGFDAQGDHFQIAVLVHVAVEFSMFGQKRGFALGRDVLPRTGHHQRRVHAPIAQLDKPGHRDLIGRNALGHDPVDGLPLESLELGR
jgi:SAM-dependent methyltransferase